MVYSVGQETPPAEPKLVGPTQIQFEPATPLMTISPEPWQLPGSV